MAKSEKHNVRRLCIFLLQEYNGTENGEQKRRPWKGS